MTSSKSSRLNTIITVRDHQQRQTTRELSQIQRQKLQEKQRLEEMHGKHSTAMDASFSAPRSTAKDVQTNSAFIQRLATDIKQQTGAVQKIEGMETVKREELIERVKAKNVIEKLQERVQTELQKEAAAKEQTLLDTLGQRNTGPSL
ncbi:MAG: flagellar export protein FliJ [Bacteroidetes bacterium]|nr:flagellar export protein FliJ [Bacteroidota bacterium]